MDVAAHLTGLAARKATGQLEITSSAGTAHLVVHDARLCAAQTSSSRATLVQRLLSTGHLTQVGYGSALRVHQEHSQIGLGEALVRMGLVTRQDMEAAQREQMFGDVATILNWPSPQASFRAGSIGATPPGAVTIEEAIEAALARNEQWHKVEQTVGGLLAIPAPAETAATGQLLALRPAQWAVLCRVDARRTLGAIAEQTGLTRCEVGEALLELM
ncbi:MAG TPA: hypothetical protein PLT68_08775, partial [Actinomycetota bacterium]|nr:hypothetical protein [Actinomycetota bacterium]